MRLPEDIRKPLLALLVITLGTAIGSLIASIWRSMFAPFWQYVAPLVPPTTLFPLCTLLLVLVILLSAWVVYLHAHDAASRVRRRYIHGNRIGWQLHRRTKKPFCTHCLLKTPPLESPLTDPLNNGHWVCEAPDCEWEYADERYKAELLKARSGK